MTDEHEKLPKTARDRLARISHHFLSDDEVSDEAVDKEERAEKGSKKAPNNKVYTIALLNTANDGDELPVYSLSQQLAARGRSAAIIDSANDMNMVSFKNDSQQNRAVHHGLQHHTPDDNTRRLGNKRHDVHFLPVDTPESSSLSLANKVLLTANATPEGLQRAYISIKQLAAHNSQVQIGVTITGTSDEDKAEECFNSLAIAVHRFLGRDLLSYGYLSDISGETTVPHLATMSDTRSGIDTIAEIISDETGEWQQANVGGGHQKPRPVNPVSTDVKMSLNIKSVPVTSDDDLLELVADALPEILGSSYELVSDDLPFDGNHILALDSKKQPCLISCDYHDGERALTSGLSVLEGMLENRAIVQRLYPNAFNRNGQSQSRIEDTRLVVLSPNPPAGGTYLTHALSCLAFYTFRALRIDDRTGLFIEPCSSRINNSQHQGSLSDKISHAFRGGKTVLSQEESTFFQNI